MAKPTKEVQTDFSLEQVFSAIELMDRSKSTSGVSEKEFESLQATEANFEFAFRRSMCLLWTYFSFETPQGKMSEFCAVPPDQALTMPWIRLIPRARDPQNRERKLRFSPLHSEILTRVLSGSSSS